MNLEITQALHQMVEVWGASIEQRDDSGLLIVGREEEEAIGKLVRKVQDWKREQGEKQRKVADRMKKEGKRVGRGRVEAPSIEVMKLALAGGKSLRRIAKDGGCSVGTVVNRLKEAGVKY